MIAGLSLIGLSLALQVPAPNAAEVRYAELLDARSATETREHDALATLARKVKSDGDAAGARAIAALAQPPAAPGGASRFAPLSEIIPATPPGRGLANIPANPGAEPAWVRSLQSMRDKTAQQLFDLALRAVAKPPKEFSFADESLRAALVRNPNHAEARRLLGYVPHEGGWATPYAVKQLKAGYVLHGTYGWVPGSWVAHLEKGELPAPRDRVQEEPKWLPAAEADQLHGQWVNGWRIPTEHFLIRTNVPLSEAIAFSRQLEDFHQLFYALLADLFGEQLPLAQRLRTKTLVGEREGKQPHEVHYFATQQEFVEHVEPLQGPSIAGSLGIYIPITGKEKRRPAYFFRDAQGQLPVTATLYHEVSHQLLFESGLGDPERYLKNVGNYWVFEGLGTYFETLERARDGTLEVGGLVGKRIEAARTHLIERAEYIPLDEFVSYNKDRFNTEASIFLHYQEAHALAVFLMQARGRRYREGFLDYVGDAYKGNLRRLAGHSLADRLGVPYKTLDAEFLAYLKGRGPLSTAPDRDVHSPT